MNPTPEPRNPFNFLLMLASIAFVITALAFAVVPVLEEKAKALGENPPPSPFRDSLREHGGTLLLYEVAAMIVFGLASMALDRYRRLNADRKTAKNVADESRAVVTPSEPTRNHDT